MTKEFKMTVYKTNMHIAVYNGMICIYLYIAEFMRENKVFFAIMAIPWSNTHLREEGCSNNMMTKLTRFHNIIEEISVTTRKRLEMEAKSYQKEEQQSSQLSLPFYCKIQFN